MQRRPIRTKLHLAVALPRHRAAEILHALSEHEEFLVTRCHSVKHLEDILDEGTADAVLIAEDLLTDAASLPRLLRRAFLPPMIVLAADPAAWADDNLSPINWDADGAALVTAIHAAITGEAARERRRVASGPPGMSHTEPLSGGGGVASGHSSRRARALPPIDDGEDPNSLEAARTAPSRLANVIVVASGAGAPGRTTIALNLAAALGLRWPTILLDADAAGPSIAASLGARIDPSRNLLTLAYSVRDAGLAWDEALAEQTQALNPSSPEARVLCGLATPRTRGHLPRDFLADALVALAERHRWVIVDIGTDLTGDETGPAGVHRTALAAAGHAILVATPEALGIQRARNALASLVRLGVPPASIAVILNGWDRRIHHPPVEIAWALGEPLRAVIPFDPHRARLALARQYPLVFDQRSRAGREMLDFGSRVAGGQLTPYRIAQEGSSDRQAGRFPGWPFGRRGTTTSRLSMSGAGGDDD